MTPDITTVEGDEVPVIADELLDANDDPISLVEGDVVTLEVQRSGGRDEPIELACEVTSLAPAAIESASLADLPAGRYEARFVIVLLANGRRSYPNGPPIYIRVNRRIAAVEASS